MVNRVADSMANGTERMAIEIVWAAVDRTMRSRAIETVMVD